MKFKRMERFERAAWTQRGLAMATSKPARLAKKLQEKYPLISDQLPAPKPFDADAELSRRQSLLDSTEARQRAHEARCWRKARGNFFRATPDQQEAIRSTWKGWRGPLTAFYFGYVVDVATGEYEARCQRARDKERARSMEIRARERQAQTLQLQFG